MGVRFKLYNRSSKTLDWSSSQDLSWRDHLKFQTQLAPSQRPKSFTKDDWSKEMLKSLGNLTFSGDSITHISSQNLMRSPLPYKNLIPSQNDLSSIVDQICFQIGEKCEWGSKEWGNIPDCSSYLSVMIFFHSTCSPL